MNTKKLKLLDEFSSPLFRIMSVYNPDDLARRIFDNNISAFHIGNGYILSVAHNLRAGAGLPVSIPEDIYQAEILNRLNPTQVQLFNQCYSLDTQTNKRHKGGNAALFPQLCQILEQIKFGTRFIDFYSKKICSPFLIIQFRKNKFYNSAALTTKIKSSHSFSEPDLQRHTFILELQLVEGFYSADIALYKIVNTPIEVIKKIPSLEIDFGLYDETKGQYFCLQSAPADNLGRLLNNAEIVGALDQWSKFVDKFGGDYILEGLRYLIRGYFRFGSSGAPYVIYDRRSRKFKANAIQSEACPIQLAINGNRNGNFQYTNAIATPLSVIEKELKSKIGL